MLEKLLQVKLNPLRLSVVLAQKKKKKEFPRIVLYKNLMYSLILVVSLALMPPLQQTIAKPTAIAKIDQ